MTRKFLLAVAAWFAKPFVKRNMPVTDDGRNVLEAELVELRERLVEFQERIAHLEVELQKEKSGNKVLRAFIDARVTPDKTLMAPPKIVKPYAVIAVLAFALCAQGAFPPPYVHNYWDTNLVPTDASTLTNAASAQTLTDAAGLTNGTIPAARYAGSGSLSVNLGATAHASGSGGVTVGNGANTGATGGSVAVGHAADAENGLSAAFGDTATATWANSTAIGYSAATAKTNQIMLGTAAEEVRVPGTLVTDGKMSGNGAGITNIPNSSLTNVALLNGNQTFTGSNGFNSRIDANAGAKILTKGTVGTLALLPTAGNTATIAYAGPVTNDSRFMVNVTLAGTGIAAGVAFSNTFSSAYSTVPVVVAIPRNQLAAQYTYFNAYAYVTNVTTTSFTWAWGSSPSAGANNPMLFEFLILQ